MTAIISQKFHNTVADSIYDTIASRSAKYYYFLGKTTPYPFINGIESIETPISNYDYELSTRRDFVSLQEITINDVSYIVKRINWTSGVVYDDFDSYSASNPAQSGATSIETASFYVLTTDFNVYKCLYNGNNTPSIVMPTGTFYYPFTTSDGYRWKFMYNVPSALRVKFLNSLFLPVSNAINSSFYNNGGISSVTILNGGSDYVQNSTATITIENDSTLAVNIIKNETYTIKTVGTTDFTKMGSINNNIGTIFTASTFGTSLATGTGMVKSVMTPSFIIDVANVISSKQYTIVTLGNTDFTMMGTATNTIGSTFTANLSNAPIGTVSYETITIGPSSIPVSGLTIGKTYTITKIGTTNFALLGAALPFAIGKTFVATAVGAGTGTVALTTIVNNTIPVSSIVSGNTYIIDTLGTTNFTTLGSTSNTVGNIFVATHTGIINGTVSTQIIYNTPIQATSIISGITYTIVSLGTSNFTQMGAFTNTVGTTFVATESGLITGTGTGTVSGTNAILNLEISSYTGEIEKVFIESGGSGYSSGITLSVNGTGTGMFPPNSSALLIPHVINGVISYVTLSDPGLNYNSNNTSILVVSDSGSGAKLSPFIKDGQVRDIIIESPGSGYLNAVVTVNGVGKGALLQPELNAGDLSTLQSNVELLSIPGTIENIKVTNGGSGYLSNATITITGDGNGATARAILYRGTVSEIIIVDNGIGYTWANVFITGHDSTSKDAVARVIISPKGGHGKDSIDELFASTLMFYNNVSNDESNIFTLNNDYRQFGIIKDPTVYNSNVLYNKNLASACYSVVARVTSGTLSDDLQLVDNKGSRYIVISFTDTSVLLQPIDNGIITANTILTSGSIRLSISSVIIPDFDKYSGELLYIDNRVSFYQTQDQTITLQSIISF